MAKTKKATSAPTSVSVRYDLLDLPTAQHRAGLAGLLLQVESMRDRALPAESIPAIHTTGPTIVDAAFTEASLRGLFDDLYDAHTVLVESKSKWPGAPIVEERVRRDPRTGKARKLLVYEVVQPHGHFLRHFADDSKDAWHKLWRDMLWTIPRGRPTTRVPFNNRAAGSPSGEGEAVWKELVAFEMAKQKGTIRTCEVAGAILLGAQAASAEAVPFRDRVDHALLLHFWQLTVRTFVPERIDADGEREFAGFVLAIPDIVDLRLFTRRYQRALSTLTTAMHGYRPADAVVSLPAEGALEFMDGLARLTGEATSADRSDVARALAGIEFLHMVKAGNNVKTLLHGRVETTPGLMREYEGIRKTCRNPIFRSARLLAMLRGHCWYSEFAAMMIERPWPLFVQSTKTPRGIPSFAWDATRRFRSSLHNEQVRRAHAMATRTPSRPSSLESIVYRLVRTYVRTKTEQRSGITYATFKDRRVADDAGRERVRYPQAYTEAQEKVCSDLFLGLRSRRDRDFVSYFTGTVGSVAQGRNLSDEQDFRVVVRALLDEDRWQDVKTLAMLATSAASFTARSADDEDTTDPEGTTQ
jgi:CRISPR-associated protein Cmx8